VAGYFTQKGYTRVFALKGGWQAWLKADYPVEDK
jgi:rhodanese-related sulfurtransferase